MGVPLLAGDDLNEAFGWFAKKYSCATAVDRLVDQLYDGGDRLELPVLAYAAGWLSVAGGNSVLPPWVGHRFPQIPVLLHSLRDNSCGDPSCTYCREHHNPKTFLNRFFGFDDFRPQPATADGKSLQGEVAHAAARDGTLFATLPTGGGKSLCYLLPALMRYQRRNLLTIVLSPLQALMKDQVDIFSKQTGTRLAAALYGMLTMVERGEVMEGVRLGNISILYVSPEQLRNRSFVETISQREIGAWVFDEAHCLSKWGHDFRPDYFYAISFIREFATKNHAQIPPVQCFTATAKRDVRAEIVDTIQSELGLRVSRFEGGHERTNLHYEVFPVTSHEKRQTILHLLGERFTGRGCVVIYCATKKNTERLADFLQESGYAAEAFHAGLDPSLKKRLLEQFVAGEIPVICATNAFGMGIDKEDVRLVLHADIPGSLENYLQEAGRAGRDRRDAECILVFDEQDIEKQFKLSAMSRLTKREIAQMLRGIRAASLGNGEVVLTAGELLRRDDVDIDPDAISDGDTRVRTGIAWLERAGFLERNENNTRIFQGKILVKNLEEAAGKITALNLSARQRERWLDILQALMARDKRGAGFSADELAALSSFAPAEGESKNETETQRVLRTLHDMAEQGLLSKEMSLSAYIRYKVGNNAPLHLQRVCALELDFLAILRELAPDAGLEEPLEIDLRQVNQRVIDRGHEDNTPHLLKLFLHGLSRDGRGLAGQTGSVGVKSTGNNCFAVSLQRSWGNILETVSIRQQAAYLAVRVILATVRPDEKPNSNLLVEFTMESIVEGVKGDLLLFAKLRKPLAAAERALTFMHELKVIDLQHGLAVFRQAMTLHLVPGSARRRYSVQDFSPLKTHYLERNFQIHVMNEYARKALEKISTAMRLVTSYFEDDKEDFIQRYFPGGKKVLERATGEQSYTRIVDDLNNRAQTAIVAAPVERNMLVLAGPGSGKTRVVTHRVAYLLRVERVNPAAILVLCFNRSAIISLRQKLRELAGNDMLGVTTLTFHGLALRLTGRSLAVSAERNRIAEIDFAKVISSAVKLLRGETEPLGLEGDAARETMVGRFSHILVDEYQAEKHYLIENYRSTANIIAAANQLIGGNGDRMKTEHPIRINEARRLLPAGGNRQHGDPLSRGRVQIQQVTDVRAQACGLGEELQRLRRIESAFDLDSCAVLAREWQKLDLVRLVLESAEIPVNLHWGRAGGFPGLHLIRENALFLDYLKARRSTSLPASSLLDLLPNEPTADNVWQANLRGLIAETSDTPQPVPLIQDYFHEVFADQRRTRNLGKGVFLSTVHSVKGLEFDHVFILGENWRELRNAVAEEERRLYYVAMTRARETLQLFAIDTHPNPHAAALAGDWGIQRRLNVDSGARQAAPRHTLLGMEGLYLDFAGRLQENHPGRLALARLNAGDTLKLEQRADHLELVSSDGVTVGRLSRGARRQWLGHHQTVVEALIIAMVRRQRESITDEEFRKRCIGDRWEFPLVELRQAG